jgi:hypothetical protein
MRPVWANEGVMDRRPWAGERGGACCGKCGRPSGQCRCRECRKESKCLVATDTQGTEGSQQTTNLSGFMNTSAAGAALSAKGAFATGFIGGDCCVSLSVECAATAATSPFTVVVAVADSEGADLVWAKTERAGTSYRVHECVITTKPGAKLYVLASNCTARVRWCEVFSC